MITTSTNIDLLFILEPHSWINICVTSDLEFKENRINCNKFHPIYFDNETEFVVISIHHRFQMQSGSENCAKWWSLSQDEHQQSGSGLTLIALNE